MVISLKKKQKGFCYNFVSLSLTLYVTLCVLQKNNVIKLGNVLLIFKKLGSMGLYYILRTIDPTLVSDVRMTVIKALEKGTTDYYVSLYEQLLDESLDAEEKNRNSDEEDSISEEEPVQEFGGKDT